MVVGWTHPFAPLGVPLVDRDDAGAVMAAWLDHLSHDLAMPARLLLPLIPEHGAFAKALDRVLAGESRRYAAFGHHERALLAPGSRREGYLERAMSAGKRKELRRQRRRLEDVAPVTFTTTRGAPDIEAALKDFLVLEASGWKGLAGRPGCRSRSPAGSRRCAAGLSPRPRPCAIACASAEIPVV